MEQNIKQRLVGIAVIFALAVIFLPMILDGSGVKKKTLKVEIPLQPEIPFRSDFSEKMIELEAKTESMTELEARFVDESSSNTANRIKRHAETDTEIVKQAVQNVDEPKSDPVKIVKQAPANKTGGDSWVLQVGSFKDKEKAVLHRDNLRKSKIAAVFIEQFISGSQASYRVRLGPFIDRELSKVAQNKIKAKYDINGLIMKYER